MRAAARVAFAAWSKVELDRREARLAKRRKSVKKKAIA